VRIGILTGGGDVPGLNACIRSVTLSADDLGWEVLGFRRGWEGVMAIDPGDPVSIAANTIPLGRETVRGIDRAGGTILHTSRTDPRTHRDGDKTAHVLHVLERLEIEAMVTLGGDGTLRFSAHLSDQGMRVISVPKTMDNDVFGTDYCIGFSTAVSRSVEAINALRTTVGSHERIGIVELFGRRSGETALLAGFLAQVDRSIISEVPADLDVLLPLLADDKASNPAGYAMCVISEGARIAGEEGEDQERHKSASDRRALGVGQRLGAAVSARLGAGTVIQELAYLMRAGEHTRPHARAQGRQLRPRPHRHPAPGREEGRRRPPLRPRHLPRPPAGRAGHADVSILMEPKPGAGCPVELIRAVRAGSGPPPPKGWRHGPPRCGRPAGRSRAWRRVLRRRCRAPSARCRSGRPRRR
jgi:ATP-dependent phosphofructokinase / diphosphate-dependent phosphofructokinase